ncbi:hypothetical protein AMATHDRAFT_45569 [Amanita thiersii Skay4041]|uniref:Ubiquitin 3 binding protein But2 C-terminal domain-containing protein n=1 Tax=Amanita thiersii Skay4041 TaxID=703135 RepID=A0A2A9NV96_9AGAR|nr:hypothetical protein AMATHDRAFT_45569 [Amanita thiersii Skay4041]
MKTSLLLSSLLLVVPNVFAVNEYVTIRNVPKPAACNNNGLLPDGGWIANKPCGYVMGTAVAGQRFDVHVTSAAGFHYGRYRGTGGNFCTWLLPSSLDLSTGVSVAASCSDSTQSFLCNRQVFGRDFDAAPHTGDGAIIVPVNLAGCQGFYNYFVDTTFTSGRFQDPVPFNVGGTSSGGYRYSTLDGQASMVRAFVPEYGQTIWFFVPRACIAAQLPGGLHNESGDSC